MMVYQTRAVWLLLLTGVESLIFHQTTYQIDKPTSEYYLISSDYVLREHTVLFATTNKTGTPPLVFNIDVTLGGNSIPSPKQCSLSLSANKNAESVGLNSLVRFGGGNNVLLETYEQIKNGNRYTTLVFLDMYNCQIKFPLPLQLSEKNIVHKRYLYEDRFEVFTADKVICKSVSDKCLIRYHEYATIEPFQVDLVWSSLRIEQTFKDNMYLMCGLNGSGSYQVELHDFTNKSVYRVELVSLSYVEGMQIITSDLAVCWILDKKKEHTTVYCSQFDQKGGLIFSSTITYQKRVELVFLHSVRPGKIVLLTGSDQTSLSRIYITMVERDNLSEPVDDHQLDLACTGSAKQKVFAASNVNNMIKIVYICLGSENKFQYNTISIVDK